MEFGITQQTTAEHCWPVMSHEKCVFFEVFFFIKIPQKNTCKSFTNQLHCRYGFCVPPNWLIFGTFFCIKLHFGKPIRGREGKESTSINHSPYDEWWISFESENRKKNITHKSGSAKKIYRFTRMGIHWKMQLKRAHLRMNFELFFMKQTKFIFGINEKQGENLHEWFDHTEWKHQQNRTFSYL